MAATGKSTTVLPGEKKKKKKHVYTVYLFITCFKGHWNRDDTAAKSDLLYSPSSYLLNNVVYVMLEF